MSFPGPEVGIPEGEIPATFSGMPEGIPHQPIGSDNKRVSRFTSSAVTVLYTMRQRSLLETTPRPSSNGGDPYGGVWGFRAASSPTSPCRDVIESAVAPIRSIDGADWRGDSETIRKHQAALDKTHTSKGLRCLLLATQSH